ncbi:hypothetical protein RB195_013659 [Necator americanus]|uniref:Uncharacterized protein n=1 Tax=Necator americanus TaxID=51031 RepID=A0ABR1DWJ8_NECAM
MLAFVQGSHTITSKEDAMINEAKHEVEGKRRTQPEDERVRKGVLDPLDNPQSYTVERNSLDQFGDQNTINEDGKIEQLKQ